MSLMVRWFSLLPTVQMNLWPSTLADFAGSSFGNQPRTWARNSEARFSKSFIGAIFCSSWPSSSTTARFSVAVTRFLFSACSHRGGRYFPVILAIASIHPKTEVVRRPQHPHAVEFPLSFLGSLAPLARQVPLRVLAHLAFPALATVATSPWHVI